MKEKPYEPPRIVEIEITIEQAVLQSSVGDYPGWGDEKEL